MISSLNHRNEIPPYWRGWNYTGYICRGWECSGQHENFTLSEHYCTHPSPSNLGCFLGFLVSHSAANVFCVFILLPLPSFHHLLLDRCFCFKAVWLSLACTLFSVKQIGEKLLSKISFWEATWKRPTRGATVHGNNLYTSSFIFPKLTNMDMYSQILKSAQTREN